MNAEIYLDGWWMATIPWVVMTLGLGATVVGLYGFYLIMKSRSKDGSHG